MSNLPGMRRLAVLALALAVVGMACRQGPGGPPRTGTLVRTLNDDGAWCWFQDPRAVYVEGLHRRTYAQWISRHGELRVGFYDHDTDTIASVTLKADWTADDHAVGSFLVLPDRRLMVFYAHHNKRGLFARTARRPEDIAEWEDEVTVSDTSKITYSNPVYLNSEKKIFLFWRGSTWKPTVAVSTDDGATWSAPAVFIRRTAKTGGGIRPYLKVTSDGRSAIHFAFTDGHPRDEPTNSIYYMKYEEGRFYRADGSVIGAFDHPIDPRSTDIVYDARETGVRAWVWDVAVGADDPPGSHRARAPLFGGHRPESHSSGRGLPFAAGGRRLRAVALGDEESGP